MNFQIRKQKDDALSYFRLVLVQDVSRLPVTPNATDPLIQHTKIAPSTDTPDTETNYHRVMKCGLYVMRNNDKHDPDSVCHLEGGQSSLPIHADN